MAVQRNGTAPACGLVSEPCAGGREPSNAPVLSPSLKSEGVLNLENCARTRMNTGIERNVTTRWQPGSNDARLAQKICRRNAGRCWRRDRGGRGRRDAGRLQKLARTQNRKSVIFACLAPLVFESHFGGYDVIVILNRGFPCDCYSGYSGSQLLL